MARKTQISREVILEAALKMLIRDGYAAVNIKTLSKEIDCSTQPLVWHFGNMEKLRKALAEYALDYAKEVERLSLLSCPVAEVTLYFADGREVTVPYESFNHAIHNLTSEHGTLDSFRYRPESEAELGLILRRLHFKRNRQANVGDFEQHIESLQKSSVRNKLHRAKSEVKPVEKKPPKKKEPLL